LVPSTRVAAFGCLPGTIGTGRLTAPDRLYHDSTEAVQDITPSN